VSNAGNQLTADANFTYQYDDNGNLTRKTLLATGNYTQYSYDAENRLIQGRGIRGGESPRHHDITYRYDGLGRRIEKVANGQTNATSTTAKISCWSMMAATCCKPATPTAPASMSR
jgi:YD repeat-containing protein